MQVTAHEIVKSFGIESLAKFATEENRAEIAQCREDWAFANASSTYLRTFNDGDNVFEVVFSFDDMKARRTDYGTDVTSEYIEEILKAVLRRVKLRTTFGMED